ncbi:hypothetical protein FGD67_13955 [Colwellia sp. M166]|uniref:hypothetical protein n=1 Tax=Colwellia sp. M166 TaxID=2583805 RepID=UPI00211EA754|nr:hypothetical protein [Colwellia sp. M166]UUO24206.1 hypothetical protein FGD67_13955 [Colwellia sp. M166]|tara:strand:+ start:1347 stop:1751 length:405 start_codon:yes stop_codon:yes gene_type:complete
MNMTLALMGLSIYILLWEKLPDWGNWFNWIIERLPRPLAYLYQAWQCPYCFGFWVALALHGITGLQTIPALETMPSYIGFGGTAIAWILDALATATLIMLGQLCLNAIAMPAIKGYQMTKEFKQSFKEESTDSL